MDQLAHFGHVMPFGATPEAGGTRFQLWAPAQRRIAVAIGDEAERILPMTDQGNGMFGVFAASATMGMSSGMIRFIAWGFFWAHSGWRKRPGSCVLIAFVSLSGPHAG